MTFTVRDLMLHVLPANELEAQDLRLCAPNSQGAPPKPKPGPKPGPKPEPKPQCQPVTTITGEIGIEAAGQELHDLAMLRAQLQEALRSADGAAQR